MRNKEGLINLKISLLKIEKPTGSDWGIIQINNFVNTHFRFDVKDGKPVLDTNFFAEQVENPNDKHQKMSKDSELYQAVQKLLDEIYDEEIKSMKKQQAEVNERNDLLAQLQNFNDLMQDAIDRLDLEKYQKMERDFNYLIGKLEYVGKRS